MMTQPPNRTSRRRAQRLATARKKEQQQQQHQQQYMSADDYSVSTSATAAVTNATDKRIRRQQASSPSPSISSLHTAPPSLMTNAASISGGSSHNRTFVRTVTPPSSGGISSAPSWEDYDEGMYRRPRHFQTATSTNSNRNTEETKPNKASRNTARASFYEDVDSPIVPLTKSRHRSNSFNSSITTSTMPTSPDSRSAVHTINTASTSGGSMFINASRSFDQGMNAQSSASYNNYSNNHNRSMIPPSSSSVTTTAPPHTPHSTAASVTSVASATSHTSATSNFSSSRRPPINTNNSNSNGNGNHHVASIDEYGTSTPSRRSRKSVLPSSPGSVKSVRSTASTTTSLPPTSVLATTPTPGLHAIIQALQSSSAKPTIPSTDHLTTEELALWQGIQGTLQTLQTDHNQTKQTLEKIQQEQKQDFQHQLDHAREMQTEQKKEYNLALRAIQRVLADVTAEREQEQEEYEQKLQSVEQQYSQKVAAVVAPPPPPPTTAPPKSAELEEKTARITQLKNELMEGNKKLNDLKDEHLTLQRETDKKSRRILNLEREMKTVKIKQTDELKKIKRQLKELEQQSQETVTKSEQESDSKIQELQTQMEELSKKAATEKQELEAKLKKAIMEKNAKSPPPPPPPSPPPTQQSGTADGMSKAEYQKLQKEHQGTVTSLENAKKIITSLENANRSTLNDMSSKLKVKEDTLSKVQKESADRKRHLDTLATELRDIQTKYDDSLSKFNGMQSMTSRNRVQSARMRALVQHLQSSISDLQSSAVVHEVSLSTGGEPDSANVDKISDVLNDAMVAMQTVVQEAEDHYDSGDDEYGGTEVGDVNSEVGRHIDSLIRNDREAAAKELRVEADQQRLTIQKLQESLQHNKKNDENVGLRTEVKSLREQCNANMELLAKKERELSVLKSSLKVDDNDGGYISDDFSDDEDDAGDSGANGQPTSSGGYGVKDTEAWAAIMAASSSFSGILPQASTAELDAMRIDVSQLKKERDHAAKDLQAERESLANAKMIISSLEKANKSMMEDLRSRLQDSNSAIASLLDKSTEHENTTKSLRKELEQMKQQNEAQKKEHFEEVKKLKNDNAVLALRIQAKDREMEKLRNGGAITLELPEEKKEDPTATEAS